MADDLEQPIASLHMAISPITLSVNQDWIGWRTQRHDGLKGIESIITHPQQPGGSPGDPLIPWQEALKLAFATSRRLPGELIALPDLLASLDPGLSRFRSHLAVDAVQTWVLACSEFGPCILTVCTFGGLPPTQSDVRAALFASLDSKSIDVTKHVKKHANSWFENCGSLFIETERTQLISLYRFEDVDNDPGKAAFARYLSCHLQDDGNVKNFAGAYGHANSNLSYAHVGYSYSTFAAPTIEEIYSFLPTCCIAQLTWAVQRSIERYFRERSWDPAIAGPAAADTGAANMLAGFERLKLELKLFEIERLAFREALTPWQQRLFSRFITYWQIDDSDRLLEEAGDQISSFLNASVKVRAAEADQRQNLVLGIIAVLGVLGLAGTAAAYNDLLAGPWIESFHKGSAYLWGVGIFFFATLVLTVAGISFGFSRRK